MNVVGITKVTLHGGPSDRTYFVNEIEPPRWFWFSETWNPDMAWFGTPKDEWRDARKDLDHDLLVEILGVCYTMLPNRPYTRFHIYRTQDAFNAMYWGWTTLFVK